MATSRPITTRSIRRYYEQNTPLFLGWQAGPAAETIHRALWLPGVASLPEALNSSNALLLAQVQALAAHQGLARLRLADLGCGVGASLFYLMARLKIPARALGLTLSPTQARLARRRSRPLGRQADSAFLEADFLHLPLAGGFDFAFSVEAFVHAVDPGAYFTEVARILRPGGRLALVDDFLTPWAVERLPGTQQAWLEAFRSGWQAAGLSSLSQVETAAGQAGLRLLVNDDLTPCLRLVNLPDRVGRALRWVSQRLPAFHAILPSLTGSLALQQCLSLGLVQYRLLVFERS